MTTILVIEDNDGDAILVEDALLQRSHEPGSIHRAARLVDGMHLAATEGPDLVLLDLGLPDSSGLDTVRRAIREMSSVPIVVLTGMDDERLAERAVQLGAQDYLVKGRFSPETLERTIRYAIDRHAATQVLRAANEQLAQANQLKDDFIAIASHELRTPVTIISGAIQTLAQRWSGISDDDRELFVGSLRKQSDRLVDLVEDLLVLSRVERGALAPHIEDVDLRAVVTEAVEVSRNADEHVSVETPDVIVRSDRDYLLRIMVNLLDNAAKYGAPPVHLTAMLVPAGFELAVQDHGPGVDPAFRPRLFQKFERSDAPEVRREPGTGLGLAIVQALSHALEGEITYEDVADGGARFVVTVGSASNSPRTQTDAERRQMEMTP